MIETLRTLALAAGHADLPVETRGIADARVGTSLFNLLSTGSSTYTGRPVSPQIALTYSTVYAIVSGTAKTVASLPLHVKRNVGQDKQDFARDDYRYRLLMTQPNRDMAAYNWIETMVAHLLLWGNHYSYLDLDGAGRIKAIWPLEPAFVQPLRTPKYIAPDGQERGGDLIYRYYPHNPYSVPVDPGTYQQYQILHIPYLAFDGVMGYSPVALLRQSIALGLGLEEYGARFFANNAKPAFAIEYPNEVKDTGKMREMLSQFQGMENSNRPMFLWGGMKIHEYSISPEDAQFLAGREWQRGELAGVYDYPLYRLGDQSASSYASAEQADLHFGKHCIHPICRRIESKLDITVLGSKDELTCRFDLNELYRADMLTRANARKADVQGGIITPDEGRIDEGRNPMGGAMARTYMQMQMVPVENIGEEPITGSVGPVKLPVSTQKVNGKAVQ